jgi:hypothetical protein
MSDFAPGIRVRVLLPNDTYTGQVGTVQRIISDDDGLAYVVRFGERWEVAYYRRDEFTVDA